MRKAIAVTAICLAASFGLAASVLPTQSQSNKAESDALARNSKITALKAQITPLNTKIGLWQTTLTTNYTGLTPQMAQMTAGMNPTMTYKNCVKPEALTKDAWAKGLVGFHCSSVKVLFTQQ